MAQQPHTFDVFVSYAAADGAWVEAWLIPRLKAANLSICTERETFDIGVPQVVNIERAVEQSRHTLIILSPAWLASEWAGVAGLLTQTADPAACARKILPLILKACELPRRIAILHAADFTVPEHRDAQLQRVLVAINRTGDQQNINTGEDDDTPPKRTEIPEQSEREESLSRKRAPTWLGIVLALIPVLGILIVIFNDRALSTASVCVVIDDVHLVKAVALDKGRVSRTPDLWVRLFIYPEQVGESDPNKGEPIDIDADMKVPACRVVELLNSNVINIRMQSFDKKVTPHKYLFMNTIAGHDAVQLKIIPSVKRDDPCTVYDNLRGMCDKPLWSLGTEAEITFHINMETE